MNRPPQLPSSGYATFEIELIKHCLSEKRQRSGTFNHNMHIITVLNEYEIVNLMSWLTLSGLIELLFIKRKHHKRICLLNTFHYIVFVQNVWISINLVYKHMQHNPSIWFNSAENSKFQIVHTCSFIRIGIKHKITHTYHRI